jgi:hypothetical protein
METVYIVYVKGLPKQFFTAVNSVSILRLRYGKTNSKEVIEH